MTPRNTSLSICFILPNLVVLGQTVRALLRRSGIGYRWSGQKTRMMGLPGRVVFEAEASGGGDKTCGLPHPSLSPFPPLPLSIPLSFQTNQWEGRSDPVTGKFPGFPPTNTTLLPGRERNLTISSAVWIQCTNVMDKWTDGHRTTAKTAL